MNLCKTPSRGDRLKTGSWRQPWQPWAVVHVFRGLRSRDCKRLRGGSQKSIHERIPVNFRSMRSQVASSLSQGNNLLTFESAGKYPSPCFEPWLPKPNDGGPSRSGCLTGSRSGSLKSAHVANAYDMFGRRIMHNVPYNFCITQAYGA